MDYILSQKMRILLLILQKIIRRYERKYMLYDISKTMFDETRNVMLHVENA